MEKATIFQVGIGLTFLPVTAMLLASRTVFQQHREITAVVITYGIFLSAITVLAWGIS